MASTRVLRDEIAAQLRTLGTPPRMLCFGEISWDIAEIAGAATGAPGGCALNTAYALRFLGADVTLSGNPVGDDAAGDAIVADVAAHGIDARIPRRAGIATPSCRCLVEPSGERSFVLSHRDIQTFAGEYLDELGGYAFAFVQPYVRELSRELLARATPGWILMQDLPADSPFVELGDALQISLDDGGEPSPSYFRGRMKELVVTAGRRGAAHVIPGAQPRWFPATPVDHPVDTTGCGDAFRAGFMYARACGGSPEACFALGTAVGAFKACVAGSNLRTISRS